jgi:hypothetical protein
MIVRFRRDMISEERGFDRRLALARAAERPRVRSSVVAVLPDREHLSEPDVFVWLDDDAGRARVGALEPVFDLEDALRCPLETLLDYPSFVRFAFSDYNVSFSNDAIEAAATAWDARVRWRRIVHENLIDTAWEVPRGPEWRDVLERRAGALEPVRTLNQIRRTPAAAGRRRGEEEIWLSRFASEPAESRRSVPIDDLFDYDRFYMRYVHSTKRFFVYEPVETAPSEYAATSAWRRYVHELLTAE